MRKLILIAALVLISASAQAGASRGLTMAANDPPAAADQKMTEAPAAESPKTEAPKAETPKLVERPAAETPPEAPQADQGRLASDKKAEKPKHRRESTEARVVYELHRHGIYW
jgi:hypothetical protein